MDVNMSDFDLYILAKYLFIPLLVLCIPILWGPALQREARNAKLDLPMQIHSPPSVFRKIITSLLCGNGRSSDWKLLERETS
jgi:hypothetical protein